MGGWWPRNDVKAFYPTFSSWVIKIKRVQKKREEVVIYGQVALYLYSSGCNMSIFPFIFLIKASLKT